MDSFGAVTSEPTNNPVNGGQSTSQVKEERSVSRSGWSNHSLKPNLIDQKHLFQSPDPPTYSADLVAEVAAIQDNYPPIETHPNHSIPSGIPTEFVVEPVHTDQQSMGAEFEQKPGELPAVVAEQAIEEVQEKEDEDEILKEAAGTKGTRDLSVS